MPSAWDPVGRLALPTEPDLHHQHIPSGLRTKSQVDPRTLHGESLQTAYVRAPGASFSSISASQPRQPARPSTGSAFGWTVPPSSTTGWTLPDPSQLGHSQYHYDHSLAYQHPSHPPGLPRSNFTTIGFSPTSTPGAYTPHSPHSSPLPTPIGRPQNSAHEHGQVTPATPAGPAVPPVTEPRRRSSGKDEFDGPHQFLPKPADSHVEVSESQLINLTVSLHADEQDHILTSVNDRLSKCAFDFVAKYQFPIPHEADKRQVRVPGDREWTEWCHLLKRLATKRRIPMRVLWNGQIKQLVTVLENSLEMRHAAKHQSRPLKDDRNILQLISAGLQVAKMLKDPAAMEFLDGLYVQTEHIIRSRARIGVGASH